MDIAAQNILSWPLQALLVEAGWLRCAQTFCVVLFLAVPPVLPAQARDEAAAKSNVASSQVDESGAETERLSDEAKLALEKHDWLRATAALERLAKLAPAVAEVHTNLGMAYYFQGRPAEALASFERAIKLKPGIAQARTMTGICKAELGRNSEAVAILAPAFRKRAGKDTDLLVGLHLQKAYAELKQYDKAVAVGEELLRRYSKDTEVRFQVSRLYGDRSYELMADLMHSDPDSAWAHYANAEVQESLGKYDAAKSEYEEVLKRQPAMPGIHYRLGMVILRGSARTHETLEEASRAFAEELALGSYNPEAEYELAEIRREQGKYDLALGLFSNAVAKRPDFAEARIGLARTLLHLGRAAEAVPNLKEAARLDPENKVPHALLLNAYRSLGDMAAAQAEAASYQRLSQAGKTGNAQAVGAPAAQEVDP